MKVNILAIPKGEKSVISIGLIRATIPKTRVAGAIIVPIKSPKTIHSILFLAALTAKNISGAQLPSPTMNNPIKIIGQLKVSAKYLADLTIPSEAMAKTAKLKIILKIPEKDALKLCAKGEVSSQVLVNLSFLEKSQAM